MKIHRFTVFAALLTSSAFAQAPAHISYYAPENAAIIGNNNASWDNSIRINQDAHSFWVGGSHHMWIRSTGNVGIGTATPSARLEIADSGPNSFRVGISNNAANTRAQIRQSLSAVAYNASSIATIGAVSWNCYNDGNSPSWSGIFLNHNGANMTGSTYGVPTANSGHLIIQNCNNAVIGTNGMTPIHISPFGQVAATFTHNGNVGIGTASPSARLHVQGTVASGPGNEALLVDNHGVQFATRREAAGGGTVEVGTPNNHNMTFITNGSAVMFLAAGGNVGIGTINPTHKLAVNGTIKAKEIIVETTGWSDYVFADDYTLQPLAQVEAHIKEHKHLPGIPSATTVATTGVNIGDMQAALLAKVEELTLHLIAQEKEIARLRDTEKEFATLRAEIHEMRQAK
jgi:hypothetical protein